MGAIILKNRNLFAQTQPVPSIPGRLIVLSKVDSTNNYAMAKLHAGLAKHADCFFALEQTAGKGQRGKSWITAPGKNITATFVISLSHSFSPATVTKLQSFPFLFSASAALGCYDFIKGLNVPDITIKWPNDVYIGDRKAGGILIENSFQSANWNFSIIGVGINLNQTNFGHDLNNATSVCSSTGQQYDVMQSVRSLHTTVLKRIDWLNTASPQQVMHEYNQHLYMKQQEIRLKKQNAAFTTTLLHVDAIGLLHTADVINRTFATGEVEFVIG